jgi:hypothetical protein
MYASKNSDMRNSQISLNVLVVISVVTLINSTTNNWVG